jgi:hypothetical protein
MEGETGYRHSERSNDAAPPSLHTAFGRLPAYSGVGLCGTVCELRTGATAQRQTRFAGLCYPHSESVGILAHGRLH